MSLAGALAAASGVSAQAPANDSWATPVSITALPFTDTQGSVQLASVVSADPFPQCSSRRYNTLWYRHVTGPAPEYVSIKTAGSDYDTVVSVYKGAPGAFFETWEGCNDDGAAANNQAEVVGLRLDALTEYSIMIASWAPLSAASTLQFAVTPAAVHLVTKLEDTLDGACDSDCSLREAVAAHNASPGVVVVPPGTYALTLTGASEDGNATGDLDLTQAGAIYGAGAGATILDGNGADRALQVFNTTGPIETKALVGVTVRNGHAADGGGLHLAAGFYGVLRAVNVLDSSADTAGGGLYAAGSGIVGDCQFVHNTAPSGGGIFLSTTSAMQIQDSTLSENSATVTAGGMDVRAAFSELYNLTFSHNHGSSGGALFLELADGGGNSYIGNLSMVGNDAALGGGLYLRKGAAHVNNSLFAGNTASAPDMGVDCHNEQGPSTFVLGVRNIFENFHALRCPFVPQNSEGNLYNVSARVSPVLAPNGGTTPSHALLPGSPAIDSAEPTCRIRDWGIDWFLGPQRDQRGRSRATDGDGDGVGACDRGAYERTRVKGDFDSDRGTDLLLRDVAGNTYSAWLMNGTARRLEAVVTPAPASADWRVAGVDDFTGDELDDLVLRNLSTGAVEFWRLGGPNGVERQGDPIPISSAPVLDPTWTLAATADFDRDGRTDLLWRNGLTQKLSVWTMAGTERLATLVPDPDQAVHANWAVVAALDWDGNGTTDLLWYNATTGKIVQWLMNDALQRTAGRFTAPPNAGNSNWKVVAGGDYGVGTGGQPGTADIVWRNETSGKLVAWHLDWTGLRTAGAFTDPDQPEPPLAWEVAGPR